MNEASTDQRKPPWQSALNILFAVSIAACGIVLMARPVPKVAFVDNAAVLARSTVFLEARAELERRLSELQAPLERQEQEIDVLKGLLDRSSDKATIRLELEQRQNTYQTLVGDAREAAATAERDVLNPAYEFIDRVIAEYGRKHGYRLIFGAVEAGNVVYGSRGADITDELVEYINGRYEKTDGGGTD